MAPHSVVSIVIVTLCIFLLYGRVHSISESDLFPHGGQQAGDSTLFPNDDEASTQQCLSVSFPFFGVSHNCLFVHNNGIITLSERYFTEQFCSVSFPLENGGACPPVNNARVIAPFWGDVDTTRPGSGSIGSVSFREEIDDSALLNRAREIVHRGFVNHRNFDPTVLFIATWYEVGYYQHGSDRTNTFQCVLATDSQDLYVIFLYADIEWIKGQDSPAPAQVGFNAGDQRNFFQVPGSRMEEVINITQGSNIGEPGVWVYRVSGASVESGGCGIRDGDSQQANIFPNYGTILGGNAILVQGCFTAGTDSNITCRFDNTEVSAVAVSTIEVICITPAFPRVGRVQLSVFVDSEERARANFTVLSIERGHQVDVIKSSSSTDITLSNDNVINLRWDPDSLLPPLFPNQSRVDISLFELNLESRTWEERKLLETNVENDGSETITLRALQNVLRQDIAPLAIQVATSLNPSQTIDTDIYRNLISLQLRAVKWTSLFYFVKNPKTSRVACNDWYVSQSVHEVNLLASKVLPCPPTVEQARAPNSGLKENIFSSVFGNTIYHRQKLGYFHPDSATCFGEMVLNTSNSPVSEQQCCYDNSGNLLIGAPGGGSIDKISPNVDHVEHIRQDVIPFIQCCRGDTPSCWKYYERRPSDIGINYNPPLPAWTYGDPHIRTLDGLDYTFNGRGEFIFIKTNDDSFTLQGRMEPINSAMATVLTAVVAKEIESDTVMFVRNHHLLDAYVNGRETNMDVLNEQNFKNVTLKRTSNVSLSAVFSSGVYIEVKVENQFISTLVVNLPRSYYGNTKGLLGVYNGNIRDDLTPNNAEPALSIFEPNSRLQEIHQRFGITWIISDPNDSLFTYLPYQSFSDFYHPNFMPVFGLDITNLNQTVLRGLCNGGFECSYDFARTGDGRIGAATSAANAEIQRIVTLTLPIVCNPSCVNGVCTANGVCTCARGYSGPTCSDAVIEPCDVNPCGMTERCGKQAGSYVCVEDCNGDSTHPICSLQDSGPCSTNQCMNNGVCTPIITSSDSTFTCECLPGFMGDHLCRAEIDVCRSSPCLNGGTCQINTENPNGYICICPPDNPGVICNETLPTTAVGEVDTTNIYLIVGISVGVGVLVIVVVFVLLFTCCCFVVCATTQNKKFLSNSMLNGGMAHNGSIRQSTLVVSQSNGNDNVYSKLYRNSNQLSINGINSRNSSTFPPSSRPSSETLPAYSELDLRSTRSSLVPPVESREFHQSLPSDMHVSPSPEATQYSVPIIIDANSRGNYNNNGNNTPTPSTNSNNSINNKKPLHQRSHEMLDRRGSGPAIVNRQYLSPTNSLGMPIKGPGLRRHSYQCITYVRTDESGVTTQATEV